MSSEPSCDTSAIRAARLTGVSGSEDRRRSGRSPSSSRSAADEHGLRDACSMVIREAKAKDWPAIWLILKEAGTAGETLTWDSTRTEARVRAGWMREPAGRTIVAADDDGSIIGSANTHPIHP